MDKTVAEDGRRPPPEKRRSRWKPRLAALAGLLLVAASVRLAY
jgi:hypothetical protein